MKIMVQVIKKEFGQLNGQKVTAYILKNNNMEVTCIDYGCIITSVKTPDKDGNVEEVVLGFDSIDEYVQHSPYFGSIVGRVAGRIKEAAFELNGNTYHLPKNDGNNHLHGGGKWDKLIWDGSVLENEQYPTVQFTYTSPAGEEGYPGTVTVKVTYSLTNDNELIISYHAVTDEDTIINLTNHSYFNLSGNAKQDILQHELTMDSDYYLELTNELLPTGKIAPVDGTTFDFRSGRKIETGVRSESEQHLLAGKGYDHPFQLSKTKKAEIQLVEEQSGRVLTMTTDEPFVVLYTGSQISDDFTIRGVQARKYLGLCLETQGAPDAIHHPSLPSIVLEKGKTYERKTVYAFHTK